MNFNVGNLLVNSDTLQTIKYDNLIKTYLTIKYVQIENGNEVDIGVTDCTATELKGDAFMICPDSQDIKFKTDNTAYLKLKISKCTPSNV